jgi:membrane associated rhomboid family serine protease
VFGVAMPGVDNYAHVGGFAGGYVASMWLNPLRPERQEHLIAALACLLAVLISIAASILTGLPYLR